MSKWKFEPSDFISLNSRGLWGIIDTSVIAGVANAKLDAWLSEARVMYGDTVINSWSGVRETRDTHRALLIDIEELPKEPCKHEPIGGDSLVSNRMRCGVELKATWEAAECIKVNTEIIEQFNPCQDRFDNWNRHYDKHDFTMIEFLNLTNITSSDKIWVAVRLLPRFEVEVFAIECALDAAAAYATYATYAAEYADYAARAAAARAADATADDATAATAAAAAATYAADYARDRQVEILKYLTERIGKP
jgi:hypothetical protein